MKQRNSAREELLTEPKLLSDWAVQGGLVDAAIDVTDDDLVAAIELPEAIYRTVTARLDGRRLQPADVDLLNERASGAQLTPTITAHRHRVAGRTKQRRAGAGCRTCSRARRVSARYRHIQVQHRYGEHPVVKRNYCLRSHLRGLVFTLNHIAVTEDSAIVFVHDSDQHHENDH
jgi:Putative stress-induced transcription regulator